MLMIIWVPANYFAFKNRQESGKRKAKSEKKSGGAWRAATAIKKLIYTHLGGRTSLEPQWPSLERGSLAWNAVA